MSQSIEELQPSDQGQAGKEAVNPAAAPEDPKPSQKQNLYDDPDFKAFQAKVDSNFAALKKENERLAAEKDAALEEADTYKKVIGSADPDVLTKLATENEIKELRRQAEKGAQIEKQQEAVEYFRNYHQQMAQAAADVNPWDPEYQAAIAQGIAAGMDNAIPARKLIEMAARKISAPAEPERQRPLEPVAPPREGGFQPSPGASGNLSQLAAQLEVYRKNPSAHREDIARVQAEINKLIAG